MHSFVVDCFVCGGVVRYALVIRYYNDNCTLWHDVGVHGRKFAAAADVLLCVSQETLKTGTHTHRHYLTSRDSSKAYSAEFNMLFASLLREENEFAALISTAAAAGVVAAWFDCSLAEHDSCKTYVVVWRSLWWGCCAV
jgi:hypothetical protein